MQKLGIIDIGSNSIRLVIMQIRKDGSYSIIDELGDSVRLGEKTSGLNVLSKEKMDSAADTLRAFQNLCEALEVRDIICVATEAVRRASNQSKFIELVKKQLNLEIRIITGQDEAWYDYFGMVNTLSLSEGLIMDIGGSSTELILMNGRQIVNSISLPFGAITLSQMFHLENIVNEQTKKELHRFLLKHFRKIDWIQGAKPLIGIGGSFRNIGKIDRKLKKYPLDITHNYRLSNISLQNIYDMVNALSSGERKEIKGLSKDRTDIFPGALSEIAVVLELTGINEIIISGSGLREGLLYEYLLQDRQPVKDVLNYSLQNIMNNYELNQTHARQVWKIAYQLFDQLQREISAENNCHEVLKTAALLHDCGISISYYDHHKHSFYMILNSRVNGLTHKELIMAAEVALLHRKDETKIAAPYRSILSSEEILTIQKLGVLLRIAESFDRRQNGNICDVQIEYDKYSVRIKVAAREAPTLEIEDALSVETIFWKIFKRKIFIEGS
jgi:exopolyphosphatase / guanosine-5'-triphosphate,3'-diphosphate pyrophosphatase